MSICKAIAAAAAALALTAPAAWAQSLAVVEVGAPAVNCVFDPTCTVTVTDTVGFIPLPYLAAPKTAFLQSRTFTGAAGTPGAGKTGYIYRISLTQAGGTADCLGGLVLNFGPVAKLPYKNNQPADVFIVTTGGLGTISLKSAEKFGNVIEFTLAKQLCLAGGPNLDNTTFFFGLAADTAPMASAAQIFSTGTPPLYNVDARVPTH
ncbi:MAG TPA: hypothetical protein VH934_19960 [Xanthobacteraceae bacterium]|jgi:hypothetical protein